MIAHVDRPSTCSNCDEDIYTVTEQTDMCVIDDNHDCGPTECIKPIKQSQSTNGNMG